MLIAARYGHRDGLHRGLDRQIGQSRKMAARLLIVQTYLSVILLYLLTALPDLVIVLLQLDIVVVDLLQCTCQKTGRDH